MSDAAPLNNQDALTKDDGAVPHPSDVPYSNPVLIADRDGTVHMLFCLEYMRCFYQRSTDDGLTWGAPTEITQAFESFKEDYPWTVLATGPNHSIQLTSGR